METRGKHLPRIRTDERGLENRAQHSTLALNPEAWLIDYWRSIILGRTPCCDLAGASSSGCFDLLSPQFVRHERKTIYRGYTRMNADWKIGLSTQHSTLSTQPQGMVNRLLAINHFGENALLRHRGSFILGMFRLALTSLRSARAALNMTVVEVVG